MADGSNASPYVEFPFDRITEVHWGGQTVAIVAIHSSEQRNQGMSLRIDGRTTRVAYDDVVDPPYTDGTIYDPTFAIGDEIAKEQIKGTGLYFWGSFLLDNPPLRTLIGTQYSWRVGAGCSPVGFGGCEVGYAPVPPIPLANASGTRSYTCGVGRDASWEGDYLYKWSEPQIVSTDPGTMYLLVNFAHAEKVIIQQAPLPLVTQNSYSLVNHETQCHTWGSAGFPLPPNYIGVAGGSAFPPDTVVDFGSLDIVTLEHSAIPLGTTTINVKTYKGGTFKVAAGDGGGKKLINEGGTLAWEHEYSFGDGAADPLGTFNISGDLP